MKRGAAPSDRRRHGVGIGPHACALLVVVVVVALAGCASSRAPPPPAQTYLCEREYVNFAWGYVRRGAYVDAQGGVYSYAHVRGAERWRPNAVDVGYVERELAARYEPGRALVRSLDADELARLRRLIAGSREAELSPRRHAAYDSGLLTTACYVYDPATRRYAPLILRERGDFRRDRQSPAAAELAEWLEDVLPGPPSRR